VALVFLVARESPWIYLPSILVMTVSDTAAALVGRAFGRHVHRVGAGTKSLEGSAAFFVSALPCVYVPLRLTAPLTGPECALAALGTAALATVLEAVSRDGSDNLSVPVGTCFALTLLVATPPIAVVLGLLTGITLARLVWAASDGPRRGRVVPDFGQNGK
jgi:phytol kinase